MFIGSKLRHVLVDDTRWDVHITQKAKTVWEAFGTYKGRSISGSGSSPHSAEMNWKRYAERSDD